ncbi:hypothetical protein [Romboutsia sp.]|nr:hypothetical protein [Romboutsia sp.]HSQ89334.1 hypothetical protein [Romboutsia sp.]
MNRKVNVRNTSLIGLGMLIFTISTSIISAIIAVYLFGGVKSAGYSYIV